MRGAGSTVQEPRFGEKRDAGANAGHQRTSHVKAAQPFEALPILADELWDIEACRRDEDEIGTLDFVQRLVGHEMSGARPVDGASVDGNARDAETGLRCRPMHRFHM
jgi:hypothetical protein